MAMMSLNVLTRTELVEVLIFISWFNYDALIIFLPETNH
jgi:hypothetical protein